MITLSPTPLKKEYLQYCGQTCKLGKIDVKVELTTIQSRSGSYSRGFKYHTRTVGYLIQQAPNHLHKYSFDHGKTWSLYMHVAQEKAGRKKVTISTQTKKEFAYDKIQAINNSYGW